MTDAETGRAADALARAEVYEDDAGWEVMVWGLRGAPMSESGRSLSRSPEELRQHIRLDHGVCAKMYPGENERWHAELHRLAAIPVPLLCRLGWHRFDGWSSMDYGSHVERVCGRGWYPGVLPCGVRERKAWGGKRWVREPQRRCTHATDGGPLPACMRCATESRHPW